MLLQARTMSYRFEREESVGEALRRVARREIDSAVEEIEDDGLDPHETAHQVRKRCKKLRGLLRLVRPSLGETYELENAWFRDRAREISGARDAGALVEALDELTRDEGASDGARALRAALAERRDRLVDGAGELPSRLAALREELLRARLRVEGWRLEREGFEAFAGGWKRTYARGRRGMGRALESRTPGAFHEWRKRVKYHWHHARLLEGCWKPVLAAYCGELKALSDLLGHDHDLALMRDLVEREPELLPSAGAARAFLELVGRRRARWQERAALLGRRIYAPEPKHGLAQLEAAWSAWREEREERAPSRC